MQGDRPTHPALLDWLAAEFMDPSEENCRGEDGKGTANRHFAVPWSMKHIHRLIMTSSTYRQSSQFRADAAKADPDDKLLWRFARRRLEGEVIRDEALSVSGLLNPRMGGPSVFPDLPPGMAARGGWKVTADEAERNRASIYVFVKRNTRYPMFESFDMPDTHESCARRNVTTSPAQALTLLNSELSLKWAQGFAGRVVESAGTSLSRQIDTAFRLAYSRPPDKAEKKMAQQFFKEHSAIIAGQTKNRSELALPPKLSKKIDPAQAATLVDFCHMLMNSNEFVFID
jgi:hypothetical protein